MLGSLGAQRPPGLITLCLLQMRKQRSGEGQWLVQAHGGRKWQWTQKGFTLGLAPFALLHAAIGSSSQSRITAGPLVCHSSGADAAFTLQHQAGPLSVRPWGSITLSLWFLVGPA